jgi:hypothetical protein
MKVWDDRKMFAPLFRGEPRSPEAQVCAVLAEYEAGTTVPRLADALFRMRLAVGVKAAVVERLQEVLADLERAARVERIPDGRYRLVKIHR